MLERFIFPFGDIEKGCRLVIYGAGNVGKQFHKQINCTEYCKVVSWIDRNWKYYQERGYKVSDASILNEVLYDVIVLAVCDEDTAAKIKESLIREYGICDKKIFWRKYSSQNMAYDEPSCAEEKNRNLELQYVEPKLFISSGAMEHMVRYMLAKDIVNHILNQNHLSLYQRFVMSSTSAEEVMTGKTWLFSDYEEKKGLANYVELFKELIASMENEGFLKSGYIPYGNNGYLANGKHRYAAALALEKKIWVRAYKTIEGHGKDIEWFRSNGFGNEDIVYILRTFCDVYDQCGIYLLYGPVCKYWDYLTEAVKKDFTVAGYVDLNFQNDYIGLGNLIRDNYYDTERDLVNIEEKVHFLLLAPLKVRILVVTDENMSDKSLFYLRMKSKKEELRKHMFIDTAKHTVIIHGSDSYEEYIHMKNIWLSNNNVSYACKRVLFDYSKLLVQRLEKLKKYLFDKNIPIDQTCILGSAGMELFGLKCADDIDFCVSNKFRDKVNESELPEGVNLKYPDSTRIDENTVFKDDVLICEPDFHFLFQDFKFISLELLYQMKKYRNLEKDKGDIRRLEVFFDSVKAFDEQRAFRNQMEREINRQFHV